MKNQDQYSAIPFFIIITLAIVFIAVAIVTIASLDEDTTDKEVSASQSTVSTQPPPSSQSEEYVEENPYLAPTQLITLCIAEVCAIIIAAAGFLVGMSSRQKKEESKKTTLAQANCVFFVGAFLAMLLVLNTRPWEIFLLVLMAALIASYVIGILAEELSYRLWQRMLPLYHRLMQIRLFQLIQAIVSK